ncbi:MAG: hypothetical protein J2P57_00385 [Acidimicrobiaceae bacterium]|nr:hypothetical protein [Acidimicrobiaceae bacterium]
MTAESSITTRARRWLYGAIGTGAVASLAFGVAASHTTVATSGSTSGAGDSGTTTQQSTPGGEDYQGYQSYDGSTDSTGVSGGQTGSSDGSSHAS